MAFIMRPDSKAKNVFPFNPRPVTGQIDDEWDALSQLLKAPPGASRRKKPPIDTVHLDLRFLEGSRRKLRPNPARREVSPKHAEYSPETSRDAFLQSYRAGRANKTRVQESQRQARRLIHGFRRGQEDLHTAPLELGARRDRAFGQWETNTGIKSLEEANACREKNVERDREADQAMKSLIWSGRARRASPGPGRVSQRVLAAGSAAARRRRHREYCAPLKHAPGPEFNDRATAARRDAYRLRQQLLRREKEHSAAADAMFPKEGYGFVRDAPKLKKKRRERDIPLW
jgi:hypothetical protein